MHNPQSDDKLRKAIFDYASERFDYNPPPLDGPATPEELNAEVGQTITEKGLGGENALKLFAEKLAPATISTDHPGFLSFIPAAPTEAASLFDLVVSASSIYGGSWLEGSGAVYAENQVLSFLAKEFGLPASAGGVFVQGGTLGNLSALAVAREEAVKRSGEKNWTIICSEEAHSSIQSVAMVLGVKTTKAASGEAGFIDYQSARQAVTDAELEGLAPMAIVGTAGTTNFGIIDDLAGLAKLAKELDVWFHVDGAYGLAGALIPELRDKFNGIESADSFIVDPHKWLFAPFDACALIYRNPKLAKRAHLQKAAYLETLDEDDEWNPSDYAIHLTRRARGLPFWFSLAAHGTDEYAKAMERTMDVAKDAAQQVRNHPNLKLVIEPSLSIVAFERVGWSSVDYEKWSDKLLADQIGFVTPSAHKGKPILRFAIVNPWTNEGDISAILATL